MMEDLGTQYQAKRQQNTADQDAADLDQLFPQAGMEHPAMEIRVFGSGAAVDGEIPPPEVTVPGKYEPRRPTDDPLGRQQPKPGDESTAGVVMKNIAEAPGAALQGAHDAVYNATAFLNPLTQWLDENVADLTYNIEAPQTGTGAVVKGVAQFLTGFIPAVKGLKAIGIADNVANPMVAGAVSDFASFSGQDAKFMDMLRELGVPDEWRVQWLETEKEGPELVERLKRAVEGAGLGLMFDGILMGARFLRSMLKADKAFKSADQSAADAEMKALEDKYGKLDEETVRRHLGDPTKPMIETRIVQPPAIGGKIVAAEKEAPALEPRALIRTTKKTKIEPQQFLREYSNVFSKEALDIAEKNAVAGDPKVRIVMMSPDDYNKLAFPREQTYKNLSKKQIEALLEEKRAGVRAAVTKGGIDEIPWLDVDGAKVVGHDGRHRADVLKEMGFDMIPVRVKGKLPEVGVDLVSETGEHTVKMPDALVRPVAGPFTGTPTVNQISDQDVRIFKEKYKTEYAANKIISDNDGKFTKEQAAVDNIDGVITAKKSKYLVKFFTKDDSGTIDGAAMVHTFSKESSDSGNVMNIGAFGTTAPGKSRILLNQMEEFARANQIDTINLVADPGAVKAYEKLGFELAGFSRMGRGPFEGVKLLGMTKKIVANAPPVKEIEQQFKSEDFETYINFARIDEPDQVKFVIGKMAEAMKGSVDEARRGVITQETTQKMADDLGMTVSELLERRKGQPFNAEEALAARQLWAASGEELLKAAKKAAGPTASDLDQFAFRRSMAIHAAIQNEVIGARTETARALAAWKIPAGGGVEKARAIQQIMDAAGGPKEAKEMARRLAILAETGADPAAIARFAARGWGAKTTDIIKEVWVNGLLSSPKTHVVNITSNTGVAMQQIYERAVAGAIRGFIGGDGVKAAEAIAMAHGLMGSTKDAFRMAAKSLKTGETGYAFNKIDVTHPHSISADAFKISSETGLGRTVDFLGNAFTVPGRLLGAEDEFFKTIGYRMEVHAQSLRQATNEGLSGRAMWDRVQQLVDNPPEHIRINAADAAMYNTFTSEVGWFGKAVMNLRDSGSPVGQLGITLVLPFVRTPTNIARYTFERTPFAPLVGQWRADIAAGGARADLALARMATGTSVMLMAMDWADSGAISGAGPADPAQREALQRSGWQPYSVRVGDRWYSYNRTDPFGSTMGFAASITEAINSGEVDQEDVDEWQEVLAMAVTAVSQVTINKTYLEGVANFTEVMSNPKRYSEGYVNDMVASFLPFTALAGATETFVDPTQREVETPWEAVQARIIGLSKDLPPRRDLWGDEIRTESGFGKVYDFVSPVASRVQNIDPIDREITRLGFGPQRIKKRTVFDGVQVSMKRYPEVYDEYVRLSGNDLKHPAWGMGAKDYLNKVTSGKHPMSTVYNMLSDENRRDFIENTVRDYRKLAQRQILTDPRFMKFAAEIQYIKEAQQQAQMPILGE